MAVPEMVRIVQRVDVVMTLDVLKKLQLYRNLVTPYLEFYAVAVQQLSVLIASREDKQFLGVEDMDLRHKIYTETEKLQNVFLSNRKSTDLRSQH
jgi:hypothetical protein